MEERVLAILLADWHGAIKVSKQPSPREPEKSANQSIS